ncbi:MAG TPA: nitroreductase/quinone reductase family protein [Dehalococcoidia bacterium]|nr:nitroreductase/quinone reductase family protein [Dehalococcoidia bacterium]
MSKTTKPRGGAIGLLNRIANPSLKFLLRSPLHGLASGGTMLITVTGRRTGSPYTTPVNYVREGETLTVFSRRERRWWRNLRGGAPVVVRLKGRDLSGTGEVLPADAPAIVAALRAARPGMSPEKAARWAEGGVMVRVWLEEHAD